MDMEEMAAEIKRLKKENAEFETFFYSTIHDVKAPLRAITNLAQWIEEDLATAEKAEWAAHLMQLRERAAGMASQLDGLVEYARLGRLKFQQPPGS